ncbi:hypothetical protein KM043_006255 [Ampulex compressa]|nr:hypothetical protein KM043_006255 [Ampulex compressa]
MSTENRGVTVRRGATLKVNRYDYDIDGTYRRAFFSYRSPNKANSDPLCGASAIAGAKNEFRDGDKFILLVGKIQRAEWSRGQRRPCRVAGTSHLIILGARPVFYWHVASECRGVRLEKPRHGPATLSSSR